MKTKIAERITKPDLLLIGLLFVIGIVSFFAVRVLAQKDGTTVRILLDGETYGTYRLAEDQSIPIQIDGTVTNTLEISNGRAKMEEADCPDQLCVHQNAIDRQGETIVCLPNRIVVEIEGAQASELDSVSR